MRVSADVEAPPASRAPIGRPAPPASKRGDFLDDSNDRVRRLKDHASGNAPNDLQAMQVLDDAHTVPNVESTWQTVLDDL